MNELPEAAAPERDELARKIWEKPELTEMAIEDVTATVFVSGGNDGMAGWNDFS